MLAASQGQVYLQSFQTFWGGLLAWLPAVLLAIIIFIVGVIIAVWVGKAVRHLINLTKIDSLLERTALRDTVQKAGFHLSVGGFIGWLVKWFIILGFLMGALQVLGLGTVNMFLGQIVVVFLPRVIVAALIVAVGSVLADLAARVIMGSARIANVASANLVGSIAKWAIWITTILFALNQLGIGSDLIQTLWTGLVFAAALAFGLAFGLGGRDAAARTIEHARDMIKH